MTRRLRGIAWDHQRGHGCLAATVDAFRAEHPDIEVVWEKRSLKDFGEGPIDELAERYDMIIFDHPFCGHAHAEGVFLDLRPILGSGMIEAARTGAVGLSGDSYHYGGAVYGLPTDAAAQTASYRPDHLAKLGEEIPRNFEAVLALARKAQVHDMAIATPACPTDAICLVLTFAANLGSPLQPDAEEFFDPALLDQVLGLVETLVWAGDPRAVDWNPIKMYETMHREDGRIVYCPYAFGYSNYARRGLQQNILATDVAGPGPDPRAGALLGGAGCGLTRSCREVEAAATYMTWLHDPETQKGPYFRAGGQPGLRAAWIDAAVNEEANGFFRDTLGTLEHAYLRPRWHGFIPFFEEAGKVVNRRLRRAIDRPQAILDLRKLYADGLQSRRDT